MPAGQIKLPELPAQEVPAPLVDVVAVLKKKPTADWQALGGVVACMLLPLHS